MLDEGLRRFIPGWDSINGFVEYFYLNSFLAGLTLLLGMTIAGFLVGNSMSKFSILIIAFSAPVLVPGTSFGYYTILFAVIGSVLFLHPLRWNIKPYSRGNFLFSPDGELGLGPFSLALLITTLTLTMVPIPPFPWVLSEHSEFLETQLGQFAPFLGFFWLLTVMAIFVEHLIRPLFSEK